MSRSTWIGVLALLLTAFAALSWWQNFEWRERPRRAALKGEARSNPLYGLEVILRGRGYTVKSLPRLKASGLPETPALLVLDADLRTWPAAESQALLDWVQEGGQLLVGLPPGGEGTGAAPLLDLLGLELSYEYSCIDWKYAPPPFARKASKRAATLEHADGISDGEALQRWLAFEQRYCSHQRLRPLEHRRLFDFSWTYGNRKTGYVFARLPLGQGAIAFASDLRFLRTEALRQPANAALTWQLLAPALQDGTQVLLVRGSALPPLHVLLVHEGWAILLPLFLALLAWLWRRSQRFGPLLPAASAPRRALREHLRAAAELALRERAGARLLQPLRRRLLSRLSLRAPELAALPGTALAAELARRHGLPAAAVDRALFSQRLQRPEALAEAVRIIHQLSEQP
jgi:uncharacterized protein (TIGR03382 family)